MGGLVDCLGANTRPILNCFQSPLQNYYPSSGAFALAFTFPNVDASELHGTFPVPADYLTNPRVTIRWTSPGTAGNIIWNLSYTAVGGDNVELVPLAGFATAVNVSDAAPGASGRRMQVQISLTAADFAAGDTVFFAFYRNKANPSDTLAADVLLLELLFEYD